MTSVCGDLVGSISRNLKQNAEWQMELLDESKKPLFRIHLVAETPDQGRVSWRPLYLITFRFGRKLRNFSKNRLDAIILNHQYAKRRDCMV
jgi:hypothetical protein